MAGVLGFLMLSRAIWALFQSILVQNGIKNTVDQSLGGCVPVAHSSKSATV